MKALKRDEEDWRVKNSCPACTYKLTDEVKLHFSMLLTYDGNDSAKRVHRKKHDDNAGPSSSTERWDGRDGGGDYWLARSKVDRWAKEQLQEMFENPASAEEAEENPCAGRWHNMINDMTSRMWGIYDETGIFVALCRHGFILIVADMVQSGELYVSLKDLFEKLSFFPVQNTL
jgi:hypothetical protein